MSPFDPNRRGTWPAYRDGRNWPAIGAIVLIMVGLLVALWLAIR